MPNDFDDFSCSSSNETSHDGPLVGALLVNYLLCGMSVKGVNIVDLLVQCLAQIMPIKSLDDVQKVMPILTGMSTVLAPLILAGHQSIGHQLVMQDELSIDVIKAIYPDLSLNNLPNLKGQGGRP